MKTLKYFFPRETFAINFRPAYKVYQVGQEKTKVLIVDNFYKYPNHVRDLFLNTPVPIWKYQKGSKNLKEYYDCRHSLNMSFGYEHVHEMIAKIVKKEFKFNVYFQQEATTNVFQLIKTPPKGYSAFPHSDIVHPGRNTQPVNALVYLNTPMECRGGTALYQHLETGRETMPISKKEFLKFEKKYLNTSETREDGLTYWCNVQKYWHKFHLIEMKFNRLIIFPSKVFHGAWHESNWFKNYPRINQVFFSIIK